MTGGFALGATDPAEGARAGARAGTPLTLDVRVTLADVAAFVADPEHTAALTGTLTFPPLGAALTGRTGHAKLFVGTSDPALKLMAYRLVVQKDGQPYCLDGAKQVRRAPVWHGWRATTTLPCRLHAGPDPSAPVAGAGVIRLSPMAFVAQLLSFAAVHATSIGDRVRARIVFLRFFSRELVDTYLRRGSRS